MYVITLKYNKTLFVLKLESTDSLKRLLTKAWTALLKNKHSGCLVNMTDVLFAICTESDCWNVGK